MSFPKVNGVLKRQLVTDVSGVIPAFKTQTYEYEVFVKFEDGVIAKPVTKFWFCPKTNFIFASRIQRG